MECTGMSSTDRAPVSRPAAPRRRAGRPALLRLAVLGAAVPILGAPPAAAQTAALAGRVADAQGAAAPGVTVTARPAAGPPVSGTTDAAGRYRLALEPGTWSLTFALAGFETERRDGVRVTAGAAAVLDVTLALAAIAERVDVVGVTPLPGVGVDRGRVSAAVTVIEGADLARGAASLADALHERLGAVSLEGTTTNPFQPTLRFRGFAASPLVGLPQGIAVYQNGVRINEPFGDAVQFDHPAAVRHRPRAAQRRRRPGLGPQQSRRRASRSASRTDSTTPGSAASSPRAPSAASTRRPSTAPPPGRGRSTAAPRISGRTAGGSNLPRK